MLALSWVLHHQWTLELASAAPSQLLHPGVTPQLLTSGSLCSVQAALLDRAPSRWLQPDHTLRQLLDSWETHTNTTSVGCPTLASPYWQGLPQVASGQERGRHQYVFTWDHRHHLSSCPKDTQLQPGAPEAGFKSHCNLASILPENELMSSCYWHLQFLCAVLLEHPPPFPGHEEEGNSPCLPPQEEGRGDQMLALLVL